MKKLKLISLITLFSLVIFSISCSPDYVEQQSNPTNPSSQSIQLNFTSGSFIGTKNNADFESGGVGTRTNMGGSMEYVLTYSSFASANRFLASISNKSSQQLSQNLNNDIQIVVGTKIYNSTSGTFNLTNEQTLQATGMEGIELIKCKFTFTGKFKARSRTTGEELESNVDINGTVIF